jgi:hypothetical protein
MDFDIIQRHFARIGARVQIGPQGLRPWRPSNGLVTLDVARDRFGEIFDLRVTPRASPRVEVIQTEPKQRHLLLLTQENDAAEKNKFLCGHDERHWFVAAVPGRSAATVRAAMEALKPGDVLARQARAGLSTRQGNRRKNAAFRRQGEWFFLPVPGMRVDPALVLRDEPLARSGGKAHWLEFAYRSGGEAVYVCDRYPGGLTEREYKALISRQPDAVKRFLQTMRRNAAVYARGRVSHLDHATIVLHDWHQVLMNRENEAPAMRHVAFLD